MQAEPLKYLETIGVPVTSANDAGIHVSRYMGELTVDDYQNHINQLTDAAKDSEILTTRKHFHIAFAYLCQNMMRQFEKLGAVDPIVCYKLALEKVQHHMKANPFMFLEDDAPSEGSRNVVDGITRPPGWKRAQAIQWLNDNHKSTRAEFVAHCVDNLGMSNAGAQSYYYMAYEAVYGKKPPAQAKGKKPVEGKVSRRDQAIDLMRADPTMTRDQFLDRCVTQLAMTIAGATTYYYIAYEAVHGCKPPKMVRGKGSKIITE